MMTLHTEDQTARKGHDTMTGGMKGCQSIVTIIQKGVQGNLTGWNNLDVVETWVGQVDTKLGGLGLMIQEE